MYMKKGLLFSMLLILGSLFGKAQDAYKINVKIKNTPSKEIYLGFYYDNNKYVKDTAKAVKPGEFVFSGDTKLEKGLYLIVLENMVMFDLLIDDNQHFTLETDTLDLIKNAKFKGHDLNAAFYDFMGKAGKKQAEIGKYRARIKELGEDADSTKIYREKISTLSKDIQDNQDAIIAKFPNSLLANMFMAGKEVPNPVPLNSKEDSTNHYYYNVKHYWDNYAWQDGGLARTPILYDRLLTYFDKMIIKVPDTLIYYTDYVLKMAEADKENFKYTVQFLYKHFGTSKMLCHENVFVHLAKNYYNADKAWWADKESLDKIAKTVRELEPTLCGQIAPNLSLPDTGGVDFYRLHDVKAKYTLITFWDPGCGHCQKEIPRLQHLLDSTLTKQGVDVYGVCTQRDLGELKKFLKEKKIRFLNTLVTEEMAKNPNKYVLELKITDIASLNLHQTYNIKSTPLMMVLDSKKRIIAQKLGVEDLIPFLKNYERQQELLKKN